MTPPSAAPLRISRPAVRPRTIWVTVPIAAPATAPFNVRSEPCVLRASAAIAPKTRKVIRQRAMSACRLTLLNISRLLSDVCSHNGETSLALTQRAGLGLEKDVHPAVSLAPGSVGVARHRGALAEAERGHAPGVDAAVRQIVFNRPGTTLGQILVGLVVTQRIGVALDDDGRLAVVVDDVGHLLERGADPGIEAGRARVEEDVGVEVHQQRVVAQPLDAGAGDVGQPLLLAVHVGAEGAADHAADGRAGQDLVRLPLALDV